jgi:hypothetical protein
MMVMGAHILTPWNTASFSALEDQHSQDTATNTNTSGMTLVQRYPGDVSAVCMLGLQLIVEIEAHELHA